MKHLLIVLLCLPVCTLAQKKPLDHSVYDNWQSIGERLISPDGKWIIYTVTPQEGDATLLLRSADNPAYRKEIPRGYGALITEDSRFLAFRIRPLFRETREARIKKKRPDEMPKDSIGIIELGKEEVFRAARV
ncbi:MAG TPA: S9 family peptidase, partial [Flavisolibacter sp.]|nr:S9 family peptidase [Flavisolibacter sp.]